MGNGGISSLPTQPRHPCIREAAFGRLHKGGRPLAAPLCGHPYRCVSRLRRQGGNPTISHHGISFPTAEYHFPSWNFKSHRGISGSWHDYMLMTTWKHSQNSRQVLFAFVAVAPWTPRTVALYGTSESPDACKTLPRTVGTICPYISEI